MVEKAETNSKSKDSLILGILSILAPFLGLVLGIVGIVFSRKALKQIEKTNERGRRLAISGLICSVAGIIIQLLVVIGYITYNSMITDSITTVI